MDKQLTLSERIERDERHRLLLSAKAKLAGGELLSAAEKRALRESELEELRKNGQPYLAAMPKADYLGTVGKHQRSMIDMRARYGFPWPVEKDARVDVRAVLAWFHEFVAKFGRKLKAGPQSDGDIELLLETGSQELKDEYLKERIESQRLDNERKRAALRQDSEELVPLDNVIEFHNTLLGLINRVQERFERDYDGPVREAIATAFEDMANDLQTMADKQLGSSDTED